jgi:hypothetical protein
MNSESGIIFVLPPLIFSLLEFKPVGEGVASFNLYTLCSHQRAFVYLIGRDLILLKCSNLMCLYISENKLLCPLDGNGCVLPLRELLTLKYVILSFFLHENTSFLPVRHTILVYVASTHTGLFSSF